MNKMYHQIFGVKDMFMFTAKLNRKKLFITIAILVLVIAALVFLYGNDSSLETGAFSKVVKNNSQRVEYLNSFGWEVEAEPLEEETVVIPRKLTDVYADYNEIQRAQGFDLTEFGGMEAVRYTYKVTNYPSENNVVADIIVFRNEVIAADVQSTALDGFMHGLQLPA